MKTRITITLDKEVDDKSFEYAHAQRISRSALINRILAGQLGLSEIANRPISRDERRDESSYGN